MRKPREYHQVKKKYTSKKGFALYYKGKMISKEKYWNMKLRELLSRNIDLYLTIRFNSDYIKKLLILEKIWNLKTPATLLKRLIDNNFALIQLDKIKQVLKHGKK
jgi:hypothetical protein